MSLDGLRAWIALLERKLSMRTRVFLVLVAIAVGGAGAGIYLGIEAQDGGVDEADLQMVRDELDDRIDGLESQIQALEAEDTGALLPETAPEPEPETSPGGNGAPDGGTEPDLGGGVSPGPSTNTEPKPKPK